MNTMIFQMINEVKWTPNMILLIYDYEELYKQKPDDSIVKGDEEELDHLPPLDSNEEEVKEGKGIKILTQKELLTRLPLSLAKIKSHSFKLKNKIRKIMYLL